MFTFESQFSRYQALVSHAARSAVGMVSAEPAAGSLTVALPAARVLLGEGGEASLPGALAVLVDGPERLVTLTGQSRPVYGPLVAHLLLRAISRQPGDAARAHVAALGERMTPVTLERDTVALVLWQALCRMEAAAGSAEEAMRRVDEVLAQSPAGGALHEQRADDQLDHWTYRELSGLHALANLALHTRRDDWWAAVDRIVDFHMEHTQPDYTTYEPWGVQAFLRRPETMVFADQQLHDVQTNLHLGGPSVALLPALLLADAAQAMEAW